MLVAGHWPVTARQTEDQDDQPEAARRSQSALALGRRAQSHGSVKFMYVRSGHAVRPVGRAPLAEPLGAVPGPVCGLSPVHAPVGVRSRVLPAPRELRRACRVTA